MLLHDPHLVNLSRFDGIGDGAAAGGGVPAGALRDVDGAPGFDSELVPEHGRERGDVSRCQFHGVRVLRACEIPQGTAGQCSALARLRSLRQPASAVLMTARISRDADAARAHVHDPRGGVEVEQERQRAVEAGEGRAALYGGELAELDLDAIAIAVGAGTREPRGCGANAVCEVVSHQLSLSSGVGSCR